MAISLFRLLEDPAIGYVPVTYPQCNVGAADGRPRLIFPGSFDPLHQGHRQMAALAKAEYRLPLWHEISVLNVDKPPLDAADLTLRIGQDFEGHGVLVTRAAHFAAKAERLPESIFVVGADTLLRIGMQRYYSSLDQRNRELNRIRDLGCRFLVFGRQQTIAGQLGRRFLGDQLPIPETLRGICRFVSRDRFDDPISSSDIRNPAGRQDCDRPTPEKDS